MFSPYFENCLQKEKWILLVLRMKIGLKVKKKFDALNLKTCDFAGLKTYFILYSTWIMRFNNFTR
jgi:hypothetical protein